MIYLTTFAIGVVVQVVWFLSIRTMFPASENRQSNGFNGFLQASTIDFSRSVNDR